MRDGKEDLFIKHYFNTVTFIFAVNFIVSEYTCLSSMKIISIKMITVLKTN